MFSLSTVTSLSKQRPTLLNFSLVSDHACAYSQQASSLSVSFSSDRALNLRLYLFPTLGFYPCLSLSLRVDVIVDDLKDGAEYRLSGSASNHEAIQVRQLDQFVRIHLCHTACVHDSDHTCLGLADVIANPSSDELSGLLCLIRTSDYVCVQCPQRFIDKNDIGPVLDVGSFKSLELLHEDLLVALVLSVFLCLSDAVQNTQVTVLCLEYLLVDNLLSLFVLSASFAVSNHHVMHLVVFDVISSDFSSVGTLTISAAVLRTDNDSRFDDSLHQGQVKEARQHHDIYRDTQKQKRKEFVVVPLLVSQSSAL